MQQPVNVPNPRWWNPKHDMQWQTVRDELRRDPSSGDITDDQWMHAEPGMRYGYGAASQYAAETDWTDKLETKLRQEWNDLKTGRTWDEAKAAVRRGWDAARRKVRKSS